MPRMKFSWNDKKAASNFAKHRVSFDEATAVFDDQNALIDLDDNDDEERWQTIGRSIQGVLFVVYVERGASTIRIISARRATRHEEDRYYRQARP